MLAGQYGGPLLKKDSTRKQLLMVLIKQLDAVVQGPYVMVYCHTDVNLLPYVVLLFFTSWCVWNISIVCFDSAFSPFLTHVVMSLFFYYYFGVGTWVQSFFVDTESVRHASPKIQEESQAVVYFASHKVDWSRVEDNENVGCKQKVFPENSLSADHSWGTGDMERVIWICSPFFSNLPGHFHVYFQSFSKRRSSVVICLPCQQPHLPSL